MQQDTSQDAGQRQAPQAKMNLTKEEMFALQSCSRESFYYRCVPLGILFMGGTSILVNRGIMKGHPRFGALPKNMFAGLIGYIVGKISYQGECRKKIMALENSPLAEAMRKGKRGRELITDISTTLPAFTGGYSAPENTEEQEVSHLSESYSESDTQGVGLDDSKRPTIDGAPEPSRMADSDQPKYASYEDLRRRNRMEYEQKQHNAAASASSAASIRQEPQQQAPAASSSKDPYDTESRRPVRRNKYGDTIEE